MKPATDLTADELIDESRQFNVMLAAATAEDFAPAAFERRDALNVEVRRRLEAYDEARKDDRQRMIESFAGSVTVAVLGLWKAHRGRELTEDEMNRLTHALFEFFVTLGPGADSKTGCENENRPHDA